MVPGSKLSEIITSVTDKILEFIPEKRRKPVLLCAGGTVFMLIVIIVFSLARAGKTRPAAAEPLTAIPGDELFLPAEPDFAPGFIPGRTVKRPWTAEDVKPFWKDPLEGREELWREEMSAVIDKLMETVP